ncbi:Phosphatidylinositol transfer protein (PITP) [Savitreella phatthalungensis]
MGLFGASKSEETAVGEKRAGSVTTMIEHPLDGTVPAPRPTLDAAQTGQYEELLVWLKTREGSLTDDEKFYLTREQLLRFCRATRWDLSKTQQRVEETLKWRKEYGTTDLTAEHVAPENTTGKQVVIGWDKCQRPCLYLYPGRQNTPTSARQIQFVVWTLERCVDLMPHGVENIALLVNFKGATSGKIPSLGQGREVLGLLQTYYAETLGKAYVINIPWIVNGFFTFILRFMDPMTREKLKFNEDLNEFVPSEQLDETFDGKLQFDYVHDEYWPTLVELANRRRQHKIQKWREQGGGIGVSEDVLKEGLP